MMTRRIQGASCCLARAALTAVAAIAWAAPSEAQDRQRAPGLGFTRDFEEVFPEGYVYALGSYDDGSGRQLYAGGDIDQVTGQLQFMSLGIVRWDGTVWSRVSWGVDWQSPNPAAYGVYSLQAFDDGGGSELYLGGQFNRYWSSTSNNYLPCDGIATWDGSSLKPLPQPDPLLSVAYVADMRVFDDGSGTSLYLAGRSSNGTMYRYSALGVQSFGEVMAPPGPWSTRFARLAIHDDGTGAKLYVAGNFDRIFGGPGPTNPMRANGLAVWDGSHWTPILGPWPAPYLLDFWLHDGQMISYDDGSGASLFLAAGPLWRYRNGAWDEILPMSLGVAPPRVLGVYDDGNGPALYVTGQSLPIPGIPPGEHVQLAKYDHGVWHALGENSLSHWLNQPSNCAYTYDFGEGPDLYIGNSGGGQTGGGQTPVSLSRYRGVHRDVAPVCGGDGALATCPCGPRGIVGRGCPNSAYGQGSLLSATGNPADDTLRLSATALPPSATTMLLQSDAYDYTPRFVGNGILCAAGSITRLALHTAIEGATLYPGVGEPTLRGMAAARGDPLPPGSVRYYQVWYRDAGVGFCGGHAAVNVTNGMRVVW